MMMIAITMFIMSLHAHLNRVIPIAILYQKARLHTMAYIRTLMMIASLQF